MPSEQPDQIQGQIESHLQGGLYGQGFLCRINQWMLYQPLSPPLPCAWCSPPPAVCSRETFWKDILDFISEFYLCGIGSIVHDYFWNVTTVPVQFILLVPVLVFQLDLLLPGQKLVQPGLRVNCENLKKTSWTFRFCLAYSDILIYFAKGYLGRICTPKCTSN